MSAIAVAKPIELDPPDEALRPLAHVVALDDEQAAHDGFQPWELHSELTLVDAELRRRLLELLPPPTDVLAPRPRQPVAAAPAPAETAEPGADRANPLAILRYFAFRVGDMLQIALMVIGAVFLLALLAEVIPH
jgi:hypothetical protein